MSDLNAHCRAAIDQAASAVQQTANALRLDRSAAHAKNDLERAHAHLSTALREITDAIGVLST